MSSKKNHFEIRRLESLTTEFSLLKSLSTQPLEAVSIDHRFVSFEAPNKSCAVGQLINLEGLLYFNDQKEKFTATGRISEAMELDQELTMYTIELHRYDTHLWNDFRHALDKAQQDVDRLFNSMRDSGL